MNTRWFDIGSVTLGLFHHVSYTLTAALEIFRWAIRNSSRYDSCCVTFLTVSFLFFFLTIVQIISAIAYVILILILVVSNSIFPFSHRGYLLRCPWFDTRVSKEIISRMNRDSKCANWSKSPTQTALYRRYITLGSLQKQIRVASLVKSV